MLPKRVESGNIGLRGGESERGMSKRGDDCWRLKSGWLCKSSKNYLKWKRMRNQRRSSAIDQ
jgi:hypothetical protein